MASLSSSTSTNMLQASPQVFIKYRGEELRNNFVSRLQAALEDGHIQYKNRKLDLEIFFTRIEMSKIALVIFSKRYSESAWCLRELVAIMAYAKKKKLIVIPIFFNVEVEDVRHRRGEFGMNLYGEHYGVDRSDMLEWEEVLVSVPSEVGLSRANYKTERDFIVDIVVNIKKVLFHFSPVWERGQGTSSNFFYGTTEQPTRDHALHGVEQRLKQLEDMLVVMPSIGKTVAEMSFHIQLISDRITHQNVQGLNEAKMFTRKTDRKFFLPPQHQVFISFRGELRYNFISHLVRALKRKKINVFIDKNEKKGEDIGHLLKRIEDSRIAIVVFSSKYTESTWCLREAEKIKEVAAQDKLKVLPIFYKVTTTDVKQLKGEFGDYFRDREWEYRNEKSVIEKWKEALAFISGKLGFELDDKSDEDEYITSIVKEVLQMLISISFSTQTVESHVNQFSYKGETSKNAFGGISSNELSNNCYSSTAQSDMYMSGFANLFNVGPNQSNYTTDNRFSGPWRNRTTSHYQPINRSWCGFSDESSDDDFGHREPKLPAKQLEAFKYKKKMD